MKRYIKAATITDDIEHQIYDAFGSSTPGYGCTFISRDGTFINIYPKLDVHEDLCDWVVDNLDVDIPDQDEGTFIRALNWIRLRSDPNEALAELPTQGLTRSQWDSLYEWICFCEERYGQRNVEISFELEDWSKSAYGNFSEDFAEDIIKKVKKLYQQ